MKGRPVDRITINVVAWGAKSSFLRVQDVHEISLGPVTQLKTNWHRTQGLILDSRT